MDQLSPSRRKFLRNTALATIGLSALNSSSLMAKALQSSEQLALSFNQFPETTNLCKEGLSSKRVAVFGTLYDQNTLFALGKTTIEVWHISPDSDEVNHMGQFKTEDNGKFKFVTDFPGNEPGLKARIHFRVAINDRTSFDYLILDPHNAYVDYLQWERNHALGIDTSTKMTQNLDRSMTVQKNIFI